MQKRRFASEQRGARNHRGDCRGLYTTLCLFTSQMVTTHSRRGLRIFLSSVQEGIHDPLMIARYVVAPVNHILKKQIQNLENLDYISKEAAVTLKLKWLVRQILFKRMLEIVGTFGWQPDCEYTSTNQKDFVEWIVGKHSTWGIKQPKGIVGVTQIAFQAYALKMEDEKLFEIFKSNKGAKILDGKGVFIDKKAAAKFVDNDYGLKKENNVGTYVRDILEGRTPIDHAYAMNAWQTPSTKAKRKATKEAVAVAPTKEKVVAPPEEEATSETRKSGRIKTKSVSYSEAAAVDLEEEEKDETPPAKKAKTGKTCDNCTSLADAVKKLQQKAEGDVLTPTVLLKKVEKVLQDHVPGIGTIMLLAEEEDMSEDESAEEEDMSEDESGDNNE